VNLPNARKSGMLSAYTKNAERRTVNIWMIIAAFVSAVLMVRISPISGAFAIGLGMLWTFMYCRITKRQFGGVTGDTAGFFLHMFELFCIAGVWIGAII
ncbi:MAG: adenosylcobinamide-GDP ribazoletransferase, partial [Firmicutes bacterium]|nr:adenosylcobinamide-GDP ribazoletransferase [Bacillota bacterium]